MTDKNGILKFLGGLAAGATLGVLFAPRSGKETREAIGAEAEARKEELDELIAKGREEWSVIRGKASDAATMTRDEADDLIRFILTEGKDLWDRMQDQAKSTAHDVAEEVSKKKDKMQRAAASDN